MKLIKHQVVKVSETPVSNVVKEFFKLALKIKKSFKENRFSADYFIIH